jgi:transposase
MHDIGELRRQGLSIQAIGSMTGFDRKTIRKYLLVAEGRPVYGPRERPPAKLDPYKPYLEERLGRGYGMVGCCSGSCRGAATRAATRF